MNVLKELDKAKNMGLAYNYYKNIILICCLLTLSSCGDNVNDECFIADTISTAKIIHIDEKDHFLYLRSSGFQEKEFFYEIYENAPIFDVCGSTNVNPRYSLHIVEKDKRVGKIIISGEKIQIIYAQDGSRITNLNDLEVVFQ